MKSPSIESYFDRLWPICRSITGTGLRDSFHILQEIVPLSLTEVPTGTKVLDWEVPNEWSISEAYLEDEEGNRIIDFASNNLHVVNYSAPVNEIISGEELKKRLYVKEELPEAIPYVTSYYSEKWGFCMSQNQYQTIDFSKKFKAVIKSSLKPGSLTYGETVIQGQSKKEIVFTSYLCHPSMANNELSGPLTLAFLYQALSRIENLYYSYRFILAPETIGSIAYLENNGDVLKENTIAGYVLTCCGDAAPLKMKKSRRGNTLAEWVTQSVLSSNHSFRVDDFDVDGSDERQYCSPGFDLPMVSLYRSKYSEYKEYHTSLDNKDLFSFEAIEENVSSLLEMIEKYESLQLYKRTNPFGEPQLGKRGLYEDLATKSSHSDALKMRMRLLNYCDGLNSLEQFAEKYNYELCEVKEEAETLAKGGLIEKL
jgi:aminopeptidase-like protein